MVDNPSIEDKGGFDFASGMDIFREPGVLKAAPKMVEVNYNAAGSTPLALPTEMVDTDDGTNIRAYIIAGDKILESTVADTVSLFITNSQGANLGVNIFGGHVYYATASKLGKVQVNAAGSKNDTFETLETDSQYHPMVPQGGTLKIGNGRYVGSLDEAGVLTNQALKLPIGYRVMTLADYFAKLFVGTRRGTLSSGIPVQDAAVFDWPGTVLSSGSALPATAYPIKMRGMRALISDGHRLFGFPDNALNILVYDGANFSEYRNFKRLGFSVNVHHGSVKQHVDNSILFAGESSFPGVFQMKDGAVCQALVPPGATPGASADYDIGFVHSGFNGRIVIGYKNVNAGTFHIAATHASGHPQDNAVVRTNWHRFGTDRNKRMAGIKLNLKPMASGVSVAVSFKTTRAGAFSTPQTVTPANQHLPLRFAVQPRAREIQYQYTYTTNAENGPELLSYDPLFEVLNSSR